MVQGHNSGNRLRLDNTILYLVNHSTPDMITRKISLKTMTAILVLSLPTGLVSSLNLNPMTETSFL